uniref:Small ribosomal subunit protein uS19c n=1 Tax=Caulerpa lentillifera TaxID=148947 RepID=A0A345HGW4_9CHLO|nr:30S ribosomal protein S19 [Caulerpa lentillifera]AXG75854.1 30S ribosomal protein S19 [Caulerpa lentillifera]QKS32315.1 30S ribosomal protein S19 [Caulerpa lentillifera]QUV75673.1 ribosomal protein S19 [Caulerpa lentillifera]
MKNSPKSFFVPRHLVKKIQKINASLQVGEKKGEGKRTAPISTWSRSSVILPSMIGHTFAVYNGQKHIPVYIREQMVGHKLGEFSPTRYFRGHKKTDRKAIRKKK